MSVIAQGGARMDLYPDVPSSSAHVRTVRDLGVTFFDCSRLHWDGCAEESYGIGLQGVRNNVFLTSKTIKRTAKEAEERRHAGPDGRQHPRRPELQEDDTEEMEDVRKRALVGSGVQAGPRA